MKVKEIAGHHVLHGLYIAGFDGFGEVLQPVSNQAQPAKSQPQPGIASGDLDSNLALLAGNITMNGADSVKK